MVLLDGRSALKRVASRASAPIADSSVTAEVGIGPNGSGGFGLEVTLNVELSGVDHDTAENLVETAHQVCPYSNATRGNIPVRLVTTVE
jgi:lipoyl-dependent peroxiredoxin